MVFAFADDSPTRPSGRNKKHRRGRGSSLNRNNSTSPNKNANANAMSPSSPGGNSYRQGGKNYSSAATRVSSLTAQSQQRQGQGGKQQKPQAYFTSDAWDNTNTSSITSSNASKNSNHQNSDNNSCTGSLTYSASSSVQSAESSNDSSFSKIMDVIDKEGEGSRDIKEFMAKQSRAAVASGSNFDACGGGQDQNAAVQGWNQRRQQAQKAQAQKSKKKPSQKQNQKNRKQPQFSMVKQQVPLNSNVDLNYSKDDSSEDDVFCVDFDENIILETIAGMDDDLARPTSQLDNQNPFRNNSNSHHPDPFFQPSSYTSPNNSAPSSPRSRGGHVTPPPNSQQKSSSTTPPGVSTPISRNNSRHSKSSSDGSWDTPNPSSPPHTAMMGHHSSSMKPPHARSAPVGSFSKTRGRSSGSGKDDKVVEDLAEAFYAKSWMCGFADAFNFDGFDKFKE